MTKDPTAYEAQQPPAPTQMAETRAEIGVTSQPASSSKALQPDVSRRSASPESIDKPSTPIQVDRRASMVEEAKSASGSLATNEGEAGEGVGQRTLMDPQILSGWAKRQTHQLVSYSSTMLWIPGFRRTSCADAKVESPRAASGSTALKG